jgi:CO dehydrogenase/acetyl-CoA synthase epsilon subunit
VKPVILIAGLADEVAGWLAAEIEGAEITAVHSPDAVAEALQKEPRPLLLIVGEQIGDAAGEDVVRVARGRVPAAGPPWS